MRGGEEYLNQKDVLNSQDEMLMELNKGCKKRKPIEGQNEMLKALNKRYKDTKPIQNQYKDG